MSDIILLARDLTKVFGEGPQQVRALRGVNLEIRRGEFLALVGPSGSGKTTFLNLAGALDVPTTGELTVLGRRVAELSRRERATLRLQSIGFVFQAYNLVPVLTARENVEFVLELQGLGPERRDRARAVLQELGLADLADRRPNELSGGQQQRVAVARAVAARPALVLADEPTANLDGENAEILHAVAVTGTYEQSPEITLSAQWVQSPSDGSGVVAPAATVTLGDRLSLLLALYVSYGSAPADLVLRSEYGAAARSGFLQLRVYL